MCTGFSCSVLGFSIFVKLVLSSTCLRISRIISNGNSLLLNRLAASRDNAYKRHLCIEGILSPLIYFLFQMNDEYMQINRKNFYLFVIYIFFNMVLYI